MARARGRTAREVFAAGEAARKRGKAEGAAPAAPAEPSGPRPGDVIDGRIWVPPGWIDPNPDAPICQLHGTPMRVGQAHGEWTCGYGFGHDVEGPCNEPHPLERRQGA